MGVQKWIAGEGGEPSIIQKRSAVFSRSFRAAALIVYLAAVFWYTLGRRSVGYYPPHFDFFWSYKLWLNGDRTNGRAILSNIAMFVPFGFLAAAEAQSRGAKGILPVFVLALVFSSLIETMQLVLLRGGFEFDDIINNASGALLGVLLYRLGMRVLPEKLLKAAQIAANAGIVLFCFGVFAFSGNTGAGAMEPLSQGLCFQAEEAYCENGRIELTGVCFWYAQNPGDFELCLQSTRTGKRIGLQTECGLSRPDTAAYFGRENEKTGFKAAGARIDANEEYEILLDYGLFRVISTGVYLTAGGGAVEASAQQQRVPLDLHYVPAALFQPPETDGTALEEIVRNGVLRVFDPGHHVYVYFYEGSLYWIADEGFCFEDDGITHLELMLWTTEQDQLPENARAAGRAYDLIGVYFESAELSGSFGRYRVCACKLPTAYAVTSVKTGYYSSGWVWQASFWPVFSFSP